MASGAERRRLRLLLPDGRRSARHDRLAAALARQHDVTGEAADEHDLVVDLSERGEALPGRVLRPLYDGSPAMDALLGRLQRGECPLLDIVDGAGAILASSYAAIGDSGRLEGRLDLILARVAALLLRAIAGTGAPLADRPVRPPAAFSPLRQVKARARRLAARLLAPLRRPGPVRHWNVALRRDDGPPDVRHFDLAAYTPLPVDPATFHADPFVHERDGQAWLFAEAFPYAAGKGHLVCAELAGDGRPGPFRTILERPWHLSYPYVFDHDGETWLAPEGSTHGGVEIYRATAFPWQWELAHHLLPDWPLVDATIFAHQGRLWLLAGARTPGGSDWDELFAWHATALAGPWTPHRLNPIKSDCRSARPGGRPLRLGNRLLRPAQRCERCYGEALTWLEIRRLTPDEFEEAEVASWRADEPGLVGPHGADLGGRIRAVDFRSPLRR